MHNDSQGLASSLETGTLQRGVQQVGDKLHSRIDRMARPVHRAVDRASASAHQSVEHLADGVSDAVQRLDAQLDRVKATPAHALDCARGYVAARPLKAVAAALALGWVLGRLGAHR